MPDDIDSQDRDLFRDAIGPVTPLRDDRVTLRRPRPEAARDEPAGDAVPARARRAAPPVSIVDGEFVRGGVQLRQMQRLRRGQLRPEAVIDLHGMTLERAHHELLRFVDHARHAGQRCLLVIHGRGLGPGEGRGVIRASVPAWLGEDADVLACCLAIQRDGGSGASYVLLRRGD